MKKKFVVGTSPVSNRIYAGFVSAGMWAAQKHDVTESAISAVAEHLLNCNEKLQFEYRGKAYELKVEQVNTEKQ